MQEYQSKLKKDRRRSPTFRGERQRDQAINRRIVSLLAIIILLASPLSGLAQQTIEGTSGEVLTLEEVIRLALSDNRQVKNAQLAVGKAEGEVAATRTLRLPSMHLYSLVSQQFVKHDAGLDNSETNVVPGVGPLFSIGTTRRPTAIFAGQILQPLSQQHRIRLGIEQAGLAREVEGEKLRQAEQTTVNQVKQTYYAILQTQSARDSLLEAIKYYRELDRVTADNVAQQVSLKADSLEVKTRLAKAEYEALNLTNQLSTEKEQLNNLLGRDVRSEFRVAAIAAAVSIDADVAVARSRALEERPEPREARLKVRQAEVERRIKKSEYIPDVSVGFTYMSFRNFNNDAIPKNSASLSVVMKWEVFDWGRKKNQIAEKDRAIEQARNSLREAENLVLIEVGDKFRKLQQTRQALLVAQLKQETARENMRVSVNKYKLQAALLSDALQTQATLADADYQYQQAVLAFWKAKADYEKAIGGDK
jgi:outer membrane protein TolC